MVVRLTMLMQFGAVSYPLESKATAAAVASSMLLENRHVRELNTILFLHVEESLRKWWPVQLPVMCKENSRSVESFNWKKTQNREPGYC